MVAIAVKTEVLKELLSDPEWRAKLEEAETLEDVARVLKGYAKAKGLKVMEV